VVRSGIGLNFLKVVLPIQESKQKKYTLDEKCDDVLLIE